MNEINDQGYSYALISNTPNNSYSYLYTYAAQSQQPLIYSLPKFSYAGSYAFTQMPLPPPPPVNINNTAVLNIVCENACYQCINPYKETVGAVSALLGICICYLVINKLNLNNIYKKVLRKIIRKKKHSRKQYNYNNSSTNIGIDATNYNSDFERV